MSNVVQLYPRVDFHLTAEERLRCVRRVQCRKLKLSDFAELLGITAAFAAGFALTMWVL